MPCWQENEKILAKNGRFWYPRAEVLTGYFNNN
jgi:hypothetical protein